MCIYSHIHIQLKPSEYSALSAILFAEILDEAQVPPGVFNMIHGYGPTVGAALSTHADVDMVSFTGSTRAGPFFSSSFFSFANIYVLLRKR